MAKNRQTERAQLEKSSSGHLAGSSDQVEVHVEELATTVIDLVNLMTQEVSRLNAEVQGWEGRERALVARNDELTAELQSCKENIIALEAQKNDLEMEMEMRMGDNDKSMHVTSMQWQFESEPGEWTSLPFERSEELQGHFVEHSNCGLSKILMKSGVEQYIFDFENMSQKNVRSGKMRSIRCALQTPPHWTRSVNLHNVFGLKNTEMVEVKGFVVELFNGIYVKSALSGSDTWWKAEGNALMRKLGDSGRIMLFAVDAAYTEKLGVEDAYTETQIADWETGSVKKSCVESPTLDSPQAVNWEEWSCCTSLVHKPHVSIVESRENGMIPFMDIAIELWDNAIHQKVHDVLISSCAHNATYQAASLCNDFTSRLQVRRVLCIENFHLWTKYHNHVTNAERDMVKYGIKVQAVEPALPHVLQTFPVAFSGVDANINECFLFHGTDYNTAVKIALEGFDFRLSKAGYYGQGTYFASQACKSHQYTYDEHGLRTILVCRVMIGDVAYAKQVDRECRRPPLHAGTPRCCDSLVANTGPMPGHQKEWQTHQEFVVFDKYQAYPELIVQYKLLDPEE